MIKVVQNTVLRRLLVISVFVVSTLVASTFTSEKAYAQTPPQQVIQQTVDKAVAQLSARKDEFVADKNKLFAMIDEVMLPAIHFQRVSKLILAKHWQSANEQQRNDFQKEFKTLLLRTYATALLEYTGKEKIVYKPIDVKPDTDKVVVKTEFISPSGTAFPVDYYLSNRKDTRWRIYNVKINGVDVVSNYRATYDSIISTKGVDGLIADLHEKNAG